MGRRSHSVIAMGVSVTVHFHAFTFQTVVFLSFMNIKRWFVHYSFVFKLTRDNLDNTKSKEIEKYS